MEQNWDDIRFFLAVSRSKSFVAAATHLKTTHSTVSRRITALEAALETKLIVRTEKGCRLTTAGEQLLPLAEKLEATVLEFQETIGGNDKQLSGIIRLGTPDGLGNCFLAPRLCLLQRKHPRLEIELIAVPRYYSLSRREVDILISLNRPTVNKVVGRRITRYKFGLFASQSYLDSSEVINSLNDLSAHSFVGYIDDLMYDKRLRFFDELSPEVHTSLRSSGIIAQMNALKAGAGIGVLPYFMAHTEKELVPVLPEKYLEREFWLQVHPDSRQLPRVRETIDFIIDQMLSNEALFLSLPVSKR